jgi:hypothetical protein
MYYFKRMFISIKYSIHYYRDVSIFRWKFLVVCVKAAYKHQGNPAMAEELPERWLRMYDYKLTLQARALLQEAIIKFKLTPREVFDV